LFKGDRSNLGGFGVSIPDDTRGRFKLLASKVRHRGESIRVTDSILNGETIQRGSRNTKSQKNTDTAKWPFFWERVLNPDTMLLQTKDHSEIEGED